MIGHRSFVLPFLAVSTLAASAALSAEFDYPDTRYPDSRFSLENLKSGISDSYFVARLPAGEVRQSNGVESWSNEYAAGSCLADGSAYNSPPCNEAPPCPSFFSGWHPVVGIEATFLRPKTNDGALTFDNGIGLAANSEQARFDHRHAAPRLWAGIENCSGWGLRSRFWTLAASDTNDELLLGGALGVEPATFRATRELTAYTIDFELTKRAWCNGWTLLGTAGARRAHLDRNESLTSIVSFDKLTAQTISDRQFDGTGVTLGLEVTRPLCVDGSWQLFFSLGNSLLWGKNDAFATNLLVTPTVNLFQLVAGDEDSQLYIFDCQAGLQWSGAIECLSSRWFTRFVVEYQFWDCDETPFQFTQSFNSVSMSGSGRDLQVQFFGLAASMGLTW